MGSRLATSLESPLHPNTKEAVVTKSEQDTIYSNNFDGLYARVMRTLPPSNHAQTPGFLRASYEASKAAKIVNQPIWKVLAGMMLMIQQGQAVGFTSVRAYRAFRPLR